MGIINIWAVLTAAFCAFLLGAAWYSPKLFGGIWKNEAGIQQAEVKKSHDPKTFAMFFIMAIIAALAFSLLIGPSLNWKEGLKLGLVIGIFFVATSFGINYMFANRSIKMLLIDAGYHIVQFAIYGLILGFWH
ncbi:MAG: hypothetical protein K0Q57_671 [Gammaproteobacteria bacterium]|jgi:hypothetical protein|nr:hypothetical protein [Gammaproteobacteria bacterium]